MRAKKHYKIDDFEKTILIGDGTWDIKVAINLKLPFIGVGKALASKGVQYIINDFNNYKELQNLLIDAKPPT